MKDAISSFFTKNFAGQKLGLLSLGVGLVFAKDATLVHDGIITVCDRFNWDYPDFITKLQLKEQLSLRVNQEFQARQALSNKVTICQDRFKFATSEESIYQQAIKAIDRYESEENGDSKPKPSLEELMAAAKNDYYINMVSEFQECLDDAKGEKK